MRLIRITIVALALIAAAGCSGSSSSSDTSASSEPSETTQAAAVEESESEDDFAGLVDIGGGREIYMECRGTGSPTVILQSGFLNANDIWNIAETHPPAVQPGLAETNRVCSYDRPGSILLTKTSADGTIAAAPAEPLPGRSDPAPMPRDPADVITELHDLLAAAEVPGPYVLVGHSLGGPLNVLYARTYPDQVIALVTVDSPMPVHRTLLAPQQWEMIIDQQRHPASYLQDPPPDYELEAYDFDVLFDEIEAAPPLPAVPFTVIVRGGNDPIPEDMPASLAEAVEAYNRIWPQAEAEFAASVPGAELITVPDTTHNVHVERPDAVIEAIHEVIAGA